MLSLLVLVLIVAFSSYAQSKVISEKNEEIHVLENEQNQTINMFVTHGHCSTPFAGVVDDLTVSAPIRTDLGNPLEDMKISFDVDPTTFKVSRGDDVTERIKTPGLFINEQNNKITFRTTNVFTMGIDWYQVNGVLSIKGIEKEVQLFVTGIRDSKDAMASSLVLEGKVNLFDWVLIMTRLLRVHPTPYLRNGCI